MKILSISEPKLSLNQDWSRDGPFFGRSHDIPGRREMLKARRAVCVKCSGFCELRVWLKNKLV